MQIGAPTLVKLLALDPEPRVYYANPPQQNVVVAVVARADREVSAQLAGDGRELLRTEDSRVLYFTIPDAAVDGLGLR